MRYILFFVTVCWSCTEQQQTDKQAVKDTLKNQDTVLKLTDQKPDLAKGKMLVQPAAADLVKPDDYLYSIDLTGTDYIIRINKEKVIVPYEKASGFLKANRQKIKGDTLSIITSDKTSYKKVVDALDLIVINNIKKYKLVTIDTAR